MAQVLLCYSSLIRLQYTLRHPRSCSGRAAGDSLRRLQGSDPITVQDLSRPSKSLGLTMPRDPGPGLSSWIVLYPGWDQKARSRADATKTPVDLIGFLQIDPGSICLSFTFCRRNWFSPPCCLWGSARTHGLSATTRE
jgi:hypothetical protein